MPTLTIRDLETETHKAIRVRAAENSISMEEQVRRILKQEFNANSDNPAAVASRIHKRFAALGGIDNFSLPERAPLEDPDVLFE